MLGDPVLPRLRSDGRHAPYKSTSEGPDASSALSGVELAAHFQHLSEGSLSPLPHRISPRLLVVLTALVALLVATTAAFASSTGWSQHQCNVASVTWARTHPHTLAYKAKYVAYLKQLTKLHSCKFAHLP